MGNKTKKYFEIFRDTWDHAATIFNRSQLHICKMCAFWGYGEQNPHQDCRVIKSHEVSFELRRRILLWVTILLSMDERHKIIQFDTLTESAEYEIMAVFKTTVYDENGFAFYKFVEAESEQDFQEYIEKCKELSLYDTGITAAYGDELLTLSTCEYSSRNGRMVVVGKNNNDNIFAR